mgnify:CR=1 FL=1
MLKTEAALEVALGDVGHGIVVGISVAGVPSHLVLGNGGEGPILWGAFYCEWVGGDVAVMVF